MTIDSHTRERHAVILEAHVQRHVVDAHITVPSDTTVTVLFGPSGSD